MSLTIILISIFILSSCSKEEKLAHLPSGLNEKCIVSDEKLDPNDYESTTYNNKTYGFCCKDCLKKFASHPSQFLPENELLIEDQLPKSLKKDTLSN